MILFLDFDGVLHPDRVYRDRTRGIVLRIDLLPLEYRGHQLFCYQQQLEQVLAEYPGARIILSTSWVSALGFSRARKHLSPGLQQRIIGATFHSQHTPNWGMQTRFEQILECIAHRKLGDAWLAIDNDAQGWPDVQFDQLVKTDDLAGIGDPAAIADLTGKLEAMAARSGSSW